MKKIITFSMCLALCVVFALTATSCSDDETTTAPVTTTPNVEAPISDYNAVTDSRYDVSNAFGSYFLYTDFNGRGAPIQRYLIEKSSLLPSKADYFINYKYDENGKLTEIEADCVKLNIEYKNDTPVSASATKRKSNEAEWEYIVTFDSNGKVVSESRSVTNFNNTTTARRIEYDSNGRIAKETKIAIDSIVEHVYTYGDNETAITSTTTSNGAQTTSEATVKYGESGLPTEYENDTAVFQYNYNKNGALSKVTETLIVQNNIRTSKFTYVGEDTVKIVSTLKNRNDVLKETITKEYKLNADGTVIEFSIHSEEPDSPIIIDLKYQYNDKGQVTFKSDKIDSKNANAEYKSYTVRKYEYNQNGNLTKEIAYSYGGDTKCDYFHEWEYDESGLNTKLTYIEYDKSENVKSKTVSEYEYDENYQKIKETTSTYDANGNLTSKK